MNVVIVICSQLFARASTLHKAKLPAMGVSSFCHRQSLSGNSYRLTLRVSSLRHPHGFEGYNTKRCCHGSHHASP
ncbi:hypothetical protein GBA52_028328 [Prunus armeniaca]|nr:hypothetical protein GBA52_028328 [Prunus armeniaca]